MIRRIFWTGLGVGLGATAGVLVARRLRRTADALTPSALVGGLSGAVANLGDAVRSFAGEVRAGMDEREDELYAALGVDPGPYPDEVT